MTPQTKEVLKEAVEILNRIQGKETTKRWFKELVLKDFKTNKTENKEHGSRTKG
jgi:hypothetical protein